MEPRARWPCAALLLSLGACSAGDAGRAPAAGRWPAGVPVVVPASAQDIRALAGRAEARATLVNVWATWCAPCREEFPVLLRVAREYQREGLELLLVSADFDDRLPEVRRFLAARGVTDTTYLKTGDDMTFIDTLDPRWSGALPATFIYDAGGRLTAFWEGQADEARFRRAVEAALAPRSPREESTP